MASRQLFSRSLKVAARRLASPAAAWLKPGRARRSVVALALAIALPGTLASAQSEEPAREYKIKAAYLFNLSKFIEWPEEKSQDAETPFTICVYGHNPFGDSLEKLREHKVKGRSIAIHYVAENQPVDSCKLVFLSRDNTAAVPKALSNAGGNAPILSVSDDKNFLASGGLISLVTENNTVLLDINLTRAKQIGFNISANLLEIAHKVQ
jgi:hypothetical protein